MSRFVAVHPATPSGALTGALLEGGWKPVPVDGLDDAVARRPDEGWAALVAETGEDGAMVLTIARKIREDQGIPLLVVVDRTRTGDLVDEPDVDDFILTPLDPEELDVRLTRLGGSTEIPADTILRYEDLELDTATYQATVGGEPCDLTYMEYELLRFFVENRGRVWTREQLLQRVWGYDYFGGSRTVDVHVRRLRAKLGEERASWITTVRSVGYRFG